MRWSFALSLPDPLEEASSRMRPYFQRILEDHRIVRHEDGTVSTAIDRIVLHERTGSIALASLSDEGIPVQNSGSVFGFVDHISATDPASRMRARMPQGEVFIDAMQDECQRHGIPLWLPGQDGHGIVHVAAPELGIAFPGATLVCPDSHTTTLGALGALAWGIGTSRCEKVLATNCLRLRPSRNLLIRFFGRRGERVSAKDIVLDILYRHGTTCALGFAVEFRNSDQDILDMDERFTLCNMAVELGATAAIVPPDTVTLNYVVGRRFSPPRAYLERMVQENRTSQATAAMFDHVLDINLAAVRPMISWGTNPGETSPVAAGVPKALSGESLVAMNYTGLEPGSSLSGLPIDGAFIGSCTNSRLSDLRRAAAVLKGKTIADRVRGIVVPGSQQVKKQAEAECLDKIFVQAGFEWHIPGCGLCFFAGGSDFKAGDRVVSTTNRNFNGRQGPNVRTHICSPETVAWSAVNGCISDIMELPDV